MNNKKPDRSPTTIGTYGLAMQKALQANGYDAAGIFAAAGWGSPPGTTGATWVWNANRSGHREPVID